jgi:hypothetical protein
MKKSVINLDLSGRKTRLVVGFVLMLFIFSTNLFSGTLYVDSAKADDSGDGSSWVNAKKYLQSAIALSNSGDEIWLKSGTYFPDLGTGQTLGSRASTFNITSGVAIYGGFDGTETLRSQRDYENNVTTLSGDIGTIDTDGDNAEHVVTFLNVANTTVLDGITVTKGFAGAYHVYSPSAVGGGIKNTSSGTSSSKPQIKNCNIIDNYSSSFGGGMYNFSSSGNECSPNISNCNFSENETYSQGHAFANITESGTIVTVITDCTFNNNDRDAIHNYNISEAGSINVTISNCVFTNHTGSLMGAIYNRNSNSGNNIMSIVNCTFQGNSTDNYGGALANVNEGSGGMTTTVTNCLFSGNTGRYGSAVYEYESTSEYINCTFSGNNITDDDPPHGPVCSEGSSCTPVFRNCIFFNNTGTAMANWSGAVPSLYYSCIEGSGGSGAGWDTDFGTDGGNNIDIDPLFVTLLSPVNAPSTAGSFYLQNGSPCLSTASLTYAPDDDLDGRSRPLGSGDDMGCYEEYDNGTLPVTLSTFTADFINNAPTLYWETQSEVDNMGWNVYRNTQEDFSTSALLTEYMVPGHGTTTEPSYYNFEDRIQNPEVGSVYYYWLESIDYSGISQVYSKVAQITIPDPSVNPPQITPPIVYDFKNVPNPINGSAKFQFTLDKSSMASVSIYNILGELVKTLPPVMTQPDETAHIFWNGKDDNGKKLTPGVYFYNLIVNGKTSETKKLIMMK